MTMPSGEDEEGYSLDGFDGPLVAGGIDDLVSRTETNIRAQKQAEIDGLDLFNNIFDLLWEGLERIPGVGLLVSLVRDLLSRLFGWLDLPSLMGGLLDLLSLIPTVDDLIDWITSLIGFDLFTLPGILTDLINGLANLINGLLTSPADFLGNIFNVVVDGINTLGQMIGGLFGAFGGITGTGAGGAVLVSDLLEAAGVTVPGLNQTVSGLSADVQALQQADNPGKNFVVNFADYEDGESESVGVPFDIDYTGTGSGRSVILNGVSTWNKVADGDVEAVGRYNGPANDGVDTETSTDAQWLQATAKGPMDVGAEQAFFARMNEDKDSYVYIKGYRPGPLNFRCELGCVVDGVPTVFATDVPAGWSLNLSLKAGVEGDPYRFQVFSGSSLIIDETDDLEVSEVGSDFRGWGWGGSTANGGAAGLASATRVSCSDMV